MKKYWQIIKNTWCEYSAYRLNFLVWRLRSFISFAMIYFFWLAVFESSAGTSKILGWQQTQILTYILGVALIRSLIFSSRTIDVGGEIEQGSLSNFLLKPLDFFKFWFTRDLADKFINIICTFFELGIFILILKPNLFIQNNLFFIFFFLLAIIMATILYFYINLFLGFLAFWTPESWSGAWGPRFVFTIIIEFFAGTIFPLDILPKTFFNLIQLTPFPYLLYFPLKIYLGQINFGQIVFGFLICLFWLVVWYKMVSWQWQKGLKLYGAEGR